MTRRTVTRGSRARVATPALAFGAIVAVVASCMPAPATEQARAVATLWSQFLVAAAIVGALVWGLITVAIVRYRRRPADIGRLPSQVADSRRLEVTWTVLPIVTILVLFGLTLVALGQVDARATTSVTVDVTAFRWQWRFAYPGTPVVVTGGPDQVAEMVVPAGEPIHIVLTSVDVDHAFYVPAFLFKRDAIPGHPNEFDLTIAEPGSYGGQCAEFCGVYHDRMLLAIRAVSRADYDAWIAARASAASAAPALPTPVPSGSGTP